MARWLDNMPSECPNIHLLCLVLSSMLPAVSLSLSRCRRLARRLRNCMLAGLMLPYHFLLWFYYFGHPKLLAAHSLTF